MIKLSSIKKDSPQTKTIFVDLNSDLGEGFGIYQNSKEEEILPYVTSVNIPCAAHAGDPIKINKAVKLAKQHKLSIGAHIGYPDIAGFGYREMNLSFEELQSLVLFQVGALKTIAESYKVQIEYVRPHGAMYKQVATDPAMAVSLASAIEIVDNWLILVCAPGTALNAVKEETKIRTAPEIIINKQYDAQGNILFDEPQITDIQTCVNVASKLIKESKLITKDGAIIDVDVKTIHLSTSLPNSINMASEIRNIFSERPLPVAISLVGDCALNL